MNNSEERIKKLSEQINTITQYFYKLNSNTFFDSFDNLNKQEIRVIDTIGKNQSCTMSEIADTINLALSTLTGIIDHLITKKYVLRERSSKDRRIVNVVLTEQGQDAYKKHQEYSLKVSSELLKFLEEEEQKTLINLLNKITEKT